MRARNNRLVVGTIVLVVLAMALVVALVGKVAGDLFHFFSIMGY